MGVHVRGALLLVLLCAANVVHVQAAQAYRSRQKSSMTSDQRLRNVEAALQGLLSEVKSMHHGRLHSSDETGPAGPAGDDGGKQAPVIMPHQGAMSLMQLQPAQVLIQGLLAVCKESIATCSADGTLWVESHTAQTPDPAAADASAAGGADTSDHDLFSFYVNKFNLYYAEVTEATSPDAKFKVLDSIPFVRTSDGTTFFSVKSDASHATMFEVSSGTGTTWTLDAGSPQNKAKWVCTLGEISTGKACSAAEFNAAGASSGASGAEDPTKPSQAIQMKTIVQKTYVTKNPNPSVCTENFIYDLTTPISALPGAPHLTGQDHWGCECNKALGNTRQSPIDLPVFPAQYTPGMEYPDPSVEEDPSEDPNEKSVLIAATKSKQSPGVFTDNNEEITALHLKKYGLRLNYKSVATPGAVHTHFDGSHIFAEADFGEFIDHDGVGWVAYRVELHLPAEHTIDGVHHDMEVQIYHKRHKETPPQHGDMATQAVISVLFDQSSVEADKNPFLESMNLLNLKWEKEDKSDKGTEAIGVLNVHHLISGSNDDKEPKDQAFYSYQGSMTAPPCHENVKWFVLRDVKTAAASAVQSSFFSAYYARNGEVAPQGLSYADNREEGNNREVQPNNGRPVSVHFACAHEDDVGDLLDDDPSKAKEPVSGHFEKRESPHTEMKWVQDGLGKDGQNGFTAVDDNDPAITKAHLGVQQQKLDAAQAEADENAKIANNRKALFAEMKDEMSSSSSSSSSSFSSTTNGGDVDPSKFLAEQKAAFEKQKAAMGMKL